ncbi:MAG TPA: ABC transporter substrate-binding protein [Verrucomicrobiae bacterium]|jgi:iron complex transport system substrate-binding protein|nr:ABC transporter substrate-binding protein [Verrucomicrobiae bacterium]
MTSHFANSYAPRRIACLQPSATVILNAIGELQRVIACTKYCADVVPEVKDGSRAILADSWTADAEQILATRPDFVIASVPYQEKALTEILKAGARFLGLAPKTLNDIYGDIAVIAGVVGRSDRGEAVIASMKDRIEEVRSKTAGLPRVRVFSEEWGKPLIASQSWVAELVDAAGGEFLGAPGKTILREKVISLDPEVIVAAWCGAGDRVPLEKIVAERGWKNLTAARNARVYCISDELLNTPAPTLLQGLDALAWAMHPELFAHLKGIRKITAVSGETVEECEG